jgi:hypothetical protein
LKVWPHADHGNISSYAVTFDLLLMSGFGSKTLMRISRAILLAVLPATLTGCAFSSGEIKLNYQPPSDLPGNHASAPHQSLSVGPITDERGVEPKLLMHKVNGYGQKTTGAYLAEQPVAEIVESSVRTALQTAGYQVTEQGNQKILKGRLITLDFDVVAGFVSATLNTKLLVEFTLYDQATQQVVWKDTIIAHGTKRSGSMFSEDYIRPAFAQAMDDLIQKLVTTDAFNQALK